MGASRAVARTSGTGVLQLRAFTSLASSPPLPRCPLPVPAAVLLSDHQLKATSDKQERD